MIYHNYYYYGNVVMIERAKVSTQDSGASQARSMTQSDHKVYVSLPGTITAALFAATRVAG